MNDLFPSPSSSHSKNEPEKNGAGGTTATFSGFLELVANSLAGAQHLSSKMLKMSFQIPSMRLESHFQVPQTRAGPPGQAHNHYDLGRGLSRATPARAYVFRVPGSPRLRASLAGLQRSAVDGYLAPVSALGTEYWTAGFPRSQRLSRPWLRLRWLGTRLSAFTEVRLCTAGFPRSHGDGYLAPGPASVGWAPGSAPSALDGRLSPQSTAISPLAPPPWLGTKLRAFGIGRPAFPQSTGGDASAAWQRRGFDFCRYLCFSGLALGFFMTTVVLVLPGCPSRHEATSRLGRRNFQSPLITFPMN